MSVDALRKYVVIVNNGSGCLFQSSDQDYTYLLTATHNITGYVPSPPRVTRFVKEGESFAPLDIDLGTLIIGENYFPHPGLLDISIVKLPRIEDLEYISRVDNLDENSQGYYLLGYPQARRGQDDRSKWFRPDDAVSILHTVVAHVREARVPDTPGYDEIDGQSGGCFIKMDGKHLVLAGIQNKIPDAEGEQMGRVEFTTMSGFDQIVRTYPGQLAPILPGYLQDFSFFKDEAFPLEVDIFDEKNIVFMRSCLRDKTQEIIDSKATPRTIGDFFKGRILVEGQGSTVLQGRNIWRIWLEFLTIINTLKPQSWEASEIAQVFNSYRLLFSDTDKDWTYEIPNLLHSDYRGLPKGSTVIVGTVAKPHRSIIPMGRIPRIDYVPDKARMKTDEGISYPFNSYDFVHINYYTGQCLIEKLDEYKDIFDEDELIAKLKIQYNELFNIA